MRNVLAVLLIDQERLRRSTRAPTRIGNAFEKNKRTPDAIVFPQSNARQGDAFTADLLILGNRIRRGLWHLPFQPHRPANGSNRTSRFSRLVRRNIAVRTS